VQLAAATAAAAVIATTGAMAPLLGADVRSLVTMESALWVLIASLAAGEECLEGSCPGLIEANRIRLVQFGIQNKTFGPYLATTHRMLILAMMRGSFFLRKGCTKELRRSLRL
jgi:hypothetical protein